MKQWNDNQLLSSVTNAKPWLASLSLNDAANEYEYPKFAHGTATSPVSIDSEAVIYSYDANGNVASITGLNDSFTYSNDALDRLTDDTSTSGGNIIYDYDRNANRTGRTIDTISEGLDYLLNSNQMSSDADGAVTHDLAGNRTSDNNGARTFNYNNAGRLWQVYENSALVATYTYNAVGQRTRKVTDQGTTFYHYDLNGKVISESTDFFASAKDYVYMGNTPVAQIDIGLTTETVNYLHTDHLNTPRRATNQAGEIVWAWNGDAFGQTLANEDPIGSGTNTAINLRFAGQYFDVETALHYNYFRYYDPSTGRYITSDPIGLEGGLNTFGYVEGNPTNSLDPVGLAPCLSAECAENIVEGCNSNLLGCAIFIAPQLPGLLFNEQFSDSNDRASEGDTPKKCDNDNNNNNKCKRLRQRAENLRKEIYNKRIPDLGNNPNGLPEYIGPGERLSETVRGHQTLLTIKLKQLKKLEEQIARECRGK